MSKFGTFECGRCRRTFDKTRSDEDAYAAMVEELGPIPVEYCVIICDECKKALDAHMAIRTPESLS